MCVQYKSECVNPKMTLSKFLNFHNYVLVQKSEHLALRMSNFWDRYEFRVNQTEFFFFLFCLESRRIGNSEPNASKLKTQLIPSCGYRFLRAPRAQKLSHQSFFTWNKTFVGLSWPFRLSQKVDIFLARSYSEL